MHRFSHGVDSYSYAGKCQCGGKLFAEPDTEKPTRFNPRETGGVARTQYLDAIVRETGVVVRCSTCNTFSTQPLSEWGIETISPGD
mgnify:CR=1 FL=1